jgi:tetratricopeptide (TPR) repeat protein
MPKASHRLPGIIAVALLLAGPLAAVDLNPPGMDARIRSAIEHGYRQEYDKAWQEVDQLIADYPENPAGCFFAGALTELVMFDDVTDSLEPAFFSYLQQAQDKASAVLRQEDNAWAYFYLGAAHTYRAVFYGWDGSYWNSFVWGTRAPGPLNRAQALDSGIVDIRLCLGVNEYFRYAAGRYLAGLSVFGSYPRSCDMVEQSIAGDGYLANTGRYSLAWIFCREKQFSAAHAMLDSLLSNYPDNRMFRRLLRDTYVAEKAYDSAIAAGEWLSGDLANKRPDNLTARAENYLSLANSYQGRCDRDAAGAYCDSIISRDGVPALAGLVRQARALKRRL